jgi:[protein-PII] uridylyltransferase
VGAVGGFGRGEQVPGSDVDLTFLHAVDGPSDVRELVDAVLYPLWDSGLPVSHSVRTVAECRAEAAARLESLTALLDARMLTGSVELVDGARTAAEEVLREDPAAFVEAIRRSRREREARFGSVGRMLEPDLKEGLGGLRDLQVLRWLTRLPEPAPAADSGLVEAALDFLLLVRAALHRASGTRSNRLLAEHHGTMAQALGVEDRPGWEARDRLMREVFRHGRLIEQVTDRALGMNRTAEQPGQALPVDLLGIVTRPEAPDILRAEDAVGNNIEHLLPEWEGVRGRPQRDPYHRFPVDVHLLETLSEAAGLLRGSDEPFAARASGSIGDSAALLLGALLHDIGKVGRGSHVQTGVAVAAGALDHLGITGERREDVLFLVREHLLLSDTATRRNLEDEDLILYVAARIGDQRRLALLYLLTVADAHATGPAAATPWRLGLIRDLVAKVSHVFEKGLMDRDRAGRLASAEKTLREALGSADVPDDDAEAFVAAAPPGYLMWVSPEDISGQVPLVIPRPRPAEVRVAVREGETPGTYRLSLGAVDRLGLLAAAAGAMTLSGLSILSAQAFTTEDGLALDVFEVRGAFEEDVDEDRWERFRSVMAEALDGKLDLRERVRSLRAHYRPVTGDVPTSVHIDEESSDFYTVVEVSAPDRLGLLFDLASTLADHDLDVHVAKVATYGARVVDVFYVRDSAGQKVNDPARSDALERSLIASSQP